MSGPLDSLTPLDFVGTASVLAVDASLQIAVVLASAGLVCALARTAPARWRHGVLAAAFASTTILLALTVRSALDPASWRVGTAAQGIAVGVWALGFLALRVRDLLASRRLEQTWRQATPRAPTDGTPVRIGGTLRSPITFGWRARVLLPTSFAAWSADDRRQVLLHETAHARRRDWATQRVATLLCHALWFHPLPWIARRLLILEAERSADEVVLRAGERPSDYAQLLLDRACHGSPSPALAAKRWLEIRIRSLLQPARTSGRFAAVGLLAVLCLPFALRDVTATEPAAQHCEPDPHGAVAKDPYRQPMPVVNGDTALAASSHDLIRRRLASLSEPELAFIHGAAHRLVRNCPYHRAGVGLSGLISVIMEPHFGLIGREDLGWASPAVEDRLRALQSALHAHGRLLDALNLDPMPEPERGDYLHGLTAWGNLTLPVPPGQRASVVAEAGRWIDPIMTQVDEYPADVKQAIDVDTTLLDQHTENRWVFKPALITYRTTLIELSALAGTFEHRAPAGLDTDFGALRGDCEALIDLLDRYISMRC